MSVDMLNEVRGGIIPCILFYCLLRIDGNAVRNFSHTVPDLN